MATAVPHNSPQIVTIPVSGSGGMGQFTVQPPSFLERWGVVFVCVIGAWLLCVCAVMLWFYLEHIPHAVSTNPQDYKALLELQKTGIEQLRDSVTFAFDLMVTKTILPLLTLLLGYLFGSKKI